ncbi:MAG: leucine-rich repeat protein [Acutalibacteraceae bacterium]
MQKHPTKTLALPKNAKRVLSVILSLVLLLSFAVFRTTALDFRYRYEILNDGTIRITSYSGSDTELIIPSTFDNMLVTSIGEHAFFRNQTLTDVTIPDGVTHIGYGAFELCSKLTNVTLPNSLNTIKLYAFSECANLTSVNIPNSVTNIELAAFLGCSQLKNITIPPSVTKIGSCAFGFIVYHSTEKDFAFKIDDFTISGYKGTAAEQYADRYGFTFIALDSETTLGDVNGDGKVTLTDAINIQKAALSMTQLSGQALINADVNSDGTVNMLDAILAQKIALQITN